MTRNRAGRAGVQRTRQPRNSFVRGGMGWSLTRSAVGFAIPLVLLVTPGFVQDPPGGPPVAVRLEIADAPEHVPSVVRD